MGKKEIAEPHETHWHLPIVFIVLLITVAVGGYMIYGIWNRMNDERTMQQAIGATDIELCGKISDPILEKACESEIQNKQITDNLNRIKAKIDTIKGAVQNQSVT